MYNGSKNKPYLRESKHMDDAITLLYQAKKTVFTTKDLALVWKETNPNNLKSKISYSVQRGILIKLTRGVFALVTNYDPKELATSLYSPSYISFETVFRETGMIFQYYETIFAAGPWSITKKIDRYSLTFRKLKDDVLLNPAGIEIRNNYSIATPERAFLDMIYLYPNYYFDNLRPINWDKCFALAPLYGNKQLIKRLTQYHKDYAEQ